MVREFSEIRSPGISYRCKAFQIETCVSRFCSLEKLSWNLHKKVQTQIERYWIRKIFLNWDIPYKELQCGCVTTLLVQIKSL